MAKRKPVTSWEPWALRSKTFLLARADLRGPVELAVAPAMLFATARCVKEHNECPAETKALMQSCITLLAPDVAAPVLALQSRTDKQRNSAGVLRAAEALIDGLAFYVFGLERIAGGKPYEAMIAEAVYLLNHLIDSGYIVPDDDSPTMAAAALMTDHVNEVAAADPTERTTRIVGAAVKRIPAYLAKLQRIGLFMALKREAA